jgi:hypothetical protein
MSSKEKEGDSVRIVLTPIKIIRDSVTGQWSTPRRKHDSIQNVKYNLRVRTPSTPVVSLSSPITKKENHHTPKPLTRASRQISFEKDEDEYEQEQSSSSDDDDDDEDDDEDESSSSDEEKIISNNNNRKTNLANKGTPATKKGRSTFLPRVNYLTIINRSFPSSFLDEYNDIIGFTK